MKKDLQNNPYESFFRFFGLRENPFNVSPDPRYLFVTRQIQETLDALAYGIETRKGMILLTGEVGTGKTTVINRLLYWMRKQHIPAASIVSSLSEPCHLFDFVFAGFGVPFDAHLNGNAVRSMNRWLIERYRAGETPVLIVDDAEGLPINVFEEIRMLLNLETPREKLLQIVLAGGPALEGKLRRPELRQLKQRIAIRCKTATLTPQEAHDYVEARLRIAGANGKQIFAAQALNAVHFYADGIPRVMNLLCEHALINAYASRVSLVLARMVEEIADEFQLHEKPPVPSIVSIAKQSVISEVSAPILRQHVPSLTDTPRASVNLASAPLSDARATLNLTDQHEILLQDQGKPSHSSPSAVFSMAPAPQLTPYEQLIVELEACQPSIACSSVTRSAEVKKACDSGTALHHIGARIFAKRPVRHLMISSVSRVVCSAQRLSTLLSLSMLGRSGLVKRDVGRLWKRLTGVLTRWTTQLSLAKQTHLNAYSRINRLVTVSATNAFSRPLLWLWRRSPNTSRLVVSRTSRPGANMPLVRWLCQPIRPFHRRCSTTSKDLKELDSKPPNLRIATDSVRYHH